MELALIIALIVIAILTILTIALQPSQKSGLIGDATDIEKREKRGSELFLYRFTIVLIIAFFALSLVYALVASGKI